MANSPSEPPEKPDPIESLASMSLEQWVETLRQSDRSFYNMIALEVWSIAKTMDHLLPGFWSRFMTNRREAMQKFLQMKQTQAPNNRPPHPYINRREE